MVVAGVVLPARAAHVAFMLTGAADIINILASVPESAPAFSFDRFYQALD